MLSLSLPSFTQLTSEVVGAVKVCPETAFSDHKGKRKSGVEKKARKLLEQLQEPLQRFLDHDETVLFIFRAQTHVTGLQQYMMGWFVYGLTACVVVITDKRYLQLRTTGSNKWDRGVQALSWESVAKIEVKGWLTKESVLHLADGKKHRVWKVPNPQFKVMKRFLPELLQAKNQGMAKPGAVARLCPECKATLQDGNYQCPGCRLLFKTEKKMRWLALLPGAAYFYCGKIGLGILDLLGETYVLLVFLVLTVGAMLSTDTNPLDWQGIMATAFVILIVLAIDVAITIYHCQHFIRDFIPTREHASPEQAFAAAGFKT